MPPVRLLLLSVAKPLGASRCPRCFGTPFGGSCGSRCLAAPRLLVSHRLRLSVPGLSVSCRAAPLGVSPTVLLVSCLSVSFSSASQQSTARLSVHRPRLFVFRCPLALAFLQSTAWQLRLLVSRCPARCFRITAINRKGPRCSPTSLASPLSWQFTAPANNCAPLSNQPRGASRFTNRASLCFSISMSRCLCLSAINHTATGPLGFPYPARCLRRSAINHTRPLGSRTTASPLSRQLAASFADARASQQSTARCPAIPLPAPLGNQLHGTSRFPGVVAHLSVTNCASRCPPVFWLAASCIPVPLVFWSAASCLRCPRCFGRRHLASRCPLLFRTAASCLPVPPVFRTAAACLLGSCFPVL